MYNRRRNRVGSCLTFCLVLLAAGVPGRAETVPRSDVDLRMEIGWSNIGQGYVRPQIRYFLGSPSVRIFAETIYEQHQNERLEGTIDFWLKGGVLASLGGGFELELSVNHLCRHALSGLSPYVLSVNEALGRLWWTGRGVRLGLGLGPYFNTAEKNFDGERPVHGLAVVNLGLTDILGSIFSLDLELKFVDFERTLHDLELRARLGWGVFLFLRNVETYGFPRTTDVGLGFRGDRLERTNFSFVSSEAKVLPDDDAHKLIVDQLVTLDLFRTPEQRILFQVEANLPIVRGEKFLGLFRPEKLTYPLALEYERRLGPGAFIFGYASYEVTMPIDTTQRYSTALGLGLGLRNQRVFRVLEKSFRYEVSAGLSSPGDYDTRVSLGANTVNGRPDIGMEAAARLNPDTRRASLMAFTEFGTGTRVRVFIGADWIRDMQPAPSNRTRAWLGFGFFHAFRPVS